MVKNHQGKTVLSKLILGIFIIFIALILFLSASQYQENKFLTNLIRPKIVAITFDDGPHPIYTPQLLDILRKYKVKATFFMIGKSVNQYPDIVKMVANEGHAIGNHTYTHPYNLTQCSTAQITKEIKDCQLVIRRVIGRRVFIFRPPRGYFNKNVIQIASRNGYRTVLWSICGNKRDATNPRLMAKRVVNHIRSGDIILLHDGTFDSRWMDVEATQFIISALQKKGYHFETIPRLLKIYKNNQTIKRIFTNKTR